MNNTSKTLAEGIMQVLLCYLSFLLKFGWSSHNKNPNPAPIGTRVGFLLFVAPTVAIFDYSKTITIPQTPPTTNSSLL